MSDYREFVDEDEREAARELVKSIVWVEYIYDVSGSLDGHAKITPEYDNLYMDYLHACAITDDLDMGYEPNFDEDAYEDGEE